MRGRHLSFNHRGNKFSTHTTFNKFDNIGMKFSSPLLKNNKQGYSTIVKSLEYSTFGDPSSVLKLEERELKREKESDIIVKMVAAPINPSDINMIQGVYGIKPSSFPAIGGNEGVGIVQDVGSNSSCNLQVGDYVIPSSPSFGTWRTYAACDPSKLTKIPNYISPQSASVLAVNPSTAYRLLHDSNLKPGDVIVQNGANSMVGQSVIQIATIMCVKTINIVRNRDADDLKKLKDKLFSMGANEVFTEEEFVSIENRKALASKYPQVSVAFNCTGGKSATELARFLSEGGEMITYGGMSRQPVTVPTSLLIFKNINIKGFWLSKWLDNHPKERLEMLEKLCVFTKEEKLKFDLEEYPINDYLSALTRFSQDKKDKKPLFYMP